jgi:hypothetical protein
VLAAHLLGRHEAGGADGGAGAGEALARHGLQGAGDAEVDDARAVDGDQDVGGLEVTVDQARAVDGGQRLGEAAGEQHHGAFRHRPVVAADDLVEGGPGDVAGGDPRGGGCGVGVEHGRGPLPADALRGGDLGGEAAPEVGLLRQLADDRLHGDGPAPVGAGQVDGAHAALAESGQQPVLAYPVRVLRRERFHLGLTPPF